LEKEMERKKVVVAKMHEELNEARDKIKSASSKDTVDKKLYDNLWTDFSRLESTHGATQEELKQKKQV